MNQRSLNVEVVTTLKRDYENIARLARLADRLTANIGLHPVPKTPS